jgi:hypothetical protein
MKIKDENIAIKQTQLDEIKWFVCLLKLIWWFLSQYDILQAQIIHLIYYITYYTWISYLYLHIIYYHSSLASLTLIILLIKMSSFSKKNSKKLCEGKYIVFLNIQNFILDMKISKFFNYFINMCGCYHGHKNYKGL